MDEFPVPGEGVPLGVSMLVKVLIGGAAVLVLFAAVVSMRRSAYRVEREREIAAPAEVVFPVLDDLQRFVGVWVLFGSPFGDADPGMQRSFAGPGSGVGQSFAWRGKKSGMGTLTIVESVPGRKVVMKLEFSKPMESTAAYEFAIAGAPTGSVVSWSTSGNHNFVGKALGLFMDMDRMLGDDLEKGLGLLESVATGRQPSTTAPNRLP